jgi:hypothetical protein
VPFTESAFLLADVDPDAPPPVAPCSFPRFAVEEQWYNRCPGGCFSEALANGGTITLLTPDLALVSLQTVVPEVGTYYCYSLRSGVQFLVVYDRDSRLWRGRLGHHGNGLLDYQYAVGSTISVELSLHANELGFPQESLSLFAHIVKARPQYYYARSAAAADQVGLGSLNLNGFEVQSCSVLRVVSGCFRNAALHGKSSLGWTLRCSLYLSFSLFRYLSLCSPLTATTAYPARTPPFLPKRLSCLLYRRHLRSLTLARRRLRHRMTTLRCPTHWKPSPLPRRRPAQAAALARPQQARQARALCRALRRLPAARRLCHLTPANNVGRPTRWIP